MVLPEDSLRSFGILNVMHSTERRELESPAGSAIPAEFMLDIPAVTRAVAILEVIGGAPEPLSLAELTMLLGYPKSSVLATCDTLASGGLLERTNRGEYRLGCRVVALASAYLLTSNITDHLSEAWSALRGQHFETVALSVLDGA